MKRIMVLTLLLGGLISCAQQPIQNPQVSQEIPTIPETPSSHLNILLNWDNFNESEKRHAKSITLTLTSASENSLPIETQTVSSQDSNVTFKALPSGQRFNISITEGFIYSEGIVCDTTVISAALTKSFETTPDETILELSPQKVESKDFSLCKTHRVSGIVTDEKNNPLAEVPVRLTVENYETRLTKTDTAGNYTFKDVTVGTPALIKISHDGFIETEQKTDSFSTNRQRNAEVNTFDFKLKPKQP